jgi:hypothetical protein
MEFLGDIVASPDPPGVDLERWKQVIAEHPNLAPAAPVVGINPFTREPEDGTNQIVVWGEAGAVDDIAASVAARLGGEYRRHRR